MNLLTTLQLSPVERLKITLTGPQALTAEGKRRAWELAEERVQQIQNEMHGLKKDKKTLKDANDELVRENKRHKMHVTALSIDNMMLRQENDRLRAELARLSKKQA